MTRVFAASLLALALLLAACNGQDDGDPVEPTEVEDEQDEATPEPEEEPEPEPEPADEPDPAEDDEPAEGDDPAGDEGFPIDEPVTDQSVIDEQYLTRVLTALEERLVDMAATAEEAGEWGPEQDLQLGQIYTSERILLYREIWEDLLVDGLVAADPTLIDIEAVSILAATNDCLEVETARDARAVYADGSGFDTARDWLVELRYDENAPDFGAPSVWQFGRHVAVQRGDSGDVVAEGFCE